MNYTIYCDGAASMEKKDKEYLRGPGGWGFVVYNNGIKIYENSAGELGTTNNIQELKALNESILWLKNSDSFDSFSEATIFSDSAYCVNIFNDWAEKWENNSVSWTRGRKHEQIENLELIKEIYYLLRNYPNIKIKKVKGHDNNAGNIYADKLAVKAKIKAATQNNS